MTRVLLSKNIENLVRKDECIRHALQRIRKFFTVEKAKMLVNAFIDSHFNYAPLIWMFCRKTLHRKIEKIHHRTLKVCIDNSYNNILLRSNSVSIHQRQLQFRQRYLKASLKSIQTSCGRSLSRKSYRTSAASRRFLGIPFSWS